MKRNYKLFLQLFLILIMVYGMININNWRHDVKKSAVVKKQNVKYVHKKKNEFQIDFAGLKEINSDTVGYIEVSNTDVKYSVVKGEDNNFYLTHDFNKEYNISGWVFGDYRNKFDGTDKNIILYGHNMKDGSIFGSLKTVLTEEWYKNEDNLFIPFSTEKENMMFRIFSIYQIEPEDYYIETEFKGNEFFSFVNIIKSRSIYDFGLSLGNNDKILTLSTCTDDGQKRIVVHAVKIS